MKTRERSFPHPVLNPATDDVRPAVFAATLRVASDPAAYHLAFEITMANESLVRLIASGEACYSVRVECRHNYFRKLYPFAAPAGAIHIPADELEGPVDVSFFVHAAAAIPDFAVSGAHEDYAGLTFAIRPGDLLALAPSVKFDADKTYDALRRISSIMRIDRSPEVPDGHMDTFFDRDKIEVQLSPADHGRYELLKGSGKLVNSLIQTISFPVVAAAVRQMRMNDDENPPRWHRQVERRLAELGVDWKDDRKTEIEIAQMLLADPLGRCFGELGNVLDGFSQENS